MTTKKKEKGSIAIAHRHLLDENVIIIPTDTVYGFSGMMGSKAEQTLCKIKKRDTKKHLIYLVADPHDVLEYIDTNFYTDEELAYLTSFWPAPLSIIFKTRNKDTIAFRCPDDVWLRSLISSVGLPIFSSSANISGRTTITNILELETTFEKEVSLIIDAGIIEGLSSTIFDASNHPFSIIRKGSFQF